MRMCDRVCTHLVIFPVQDDDPQLVVGACERVCTRLMIFLLQDQDAQLAKRMCERVCAHLSNMNAEVRWSAVKLLGMVGGRDGSQVLIKLVMQLLTDEVARVREAALGAVMCLAEGQEWAAISAIQESIVDTIGSNDRRLRRRALHVLEALSGGAEKGALMEFNATSAGSSQYIEVRSHHHTFAGRPCCLLSHHEVTICLNFSALDIDSWQMYREFLVVKAICCDWKGSKSF